MRESLQPFHGTCRLSETGLKETFAGASRLTSALKYLLSKVYQEGCLQAGYQHPRPNSKSKLPPVCRICKILQRPPGRCTSFEATKALAKATPAAAGSTSLHTYQPSAFAKGSQPSTVTCADSGNHCRPAFCASHDQRSSRPEASRIHAAGPGKTQHTRLTV